MNPEVPGPAPSPQPPGPAGPSRGVVDRANVRGEVGVVHSGGGEFFEKRYEARSRAHTTESWERERQKRASCRSHLGNEKGRSEWSLIVRPFQRKTHLESTGQAFPTPSPPSPRSSKSECGSGCSTRAATGVAARGPSPLQPPGAATSGRHAGHAPRTPAAVCM